MKYIVAVKETLYREIEVEAESKIKAEDKGWEMYRNGEVILNADDFVDGDIYVKEE